MMALLKYSDNIEKDVKDMEPNIVFYWLKYLYLENHFDNFLDHGYDDLETVKCIGEEDLKAIGVNLVKERSVLLEAVRVLRQKGAAWVYFLPHAVDNHFYETHDKIYNDEPLDPNKRFNSNSSGIGSWESSEEKLSMEKYLHPENHNKIIIKAEITPTHKYKNTQEQKKGDASTTYQKNISIKLN